MDRYQALRDLPFPVVIEALGYPLSDFKPRESGTEWAGKCPVHKPKKTSTAFSYNVDGRFACSSCAAKGRGSLDLTRFAPSRVRVHSACDAPLTLGSVRQWSVSIQRGASPTASNPPRARQWSSPGYGG